MFAEVVQMFIWFLCNSDVLNLTFMLRLQGKKDVCQIFNNILRRQIGTRSPTVEYFCSHQEVLFILLKGWDKMSLTSPPHTFGDIFGRGEGVITWA